MKKLVSITILLFSALVIFNLCFFICVDYDGNTRAWICYLFFHLAYILSLVGYLFTTRRRLAVLNSRLNAISFIYLVLSTLTCLVYLLNTDYSKESEIFVFLIELFFYLMSFHYCYLTNRKVEKGIINDLKSSSKHDGWIADLRLLISFSDNEEKTRILNSIIDEIRSCSALSNSYVYDVDNEIQSLINSLRINFSKIQVTELDNYKRQIGSVVMRRSEILKCSYRKI